MADAAVVLLTRPTTDGTGECLLDADVLRAAGVTDLSAYAYEGATDDELTPDLFV